MLSIIRRMRTRAPTCLSIGLGAFLAINRSYDRISPPDLTQPRELAIDQIYAGLNGFSVQPKFILPVQSVCTRPYREPAGVANKFICTHNNLHSPCVCQFNLRQHAPLCYQQSASKQEQDKRQVTALRKYSRIGGLRQGCIE